MFVNKNFRCELKEAEVIDRKTQCTAACSFRLKDYCFGTWIKERVPTNISSKSLHTLDLSMSNSNCGHRNFDSVNWAYGNQIYLCL